jgi:hypothetical protein
MGEWSYSATQFILDSVQECERSATLIPGKITPITYQQEAMGMWKNLLPWPQIEPKFLGHQAHNLVT